MNRIVISSALTMLLAACAKDEGPLHVPKPVIPGEPVDTAYFNSEVLPILAARCWTCHPPMGGMDLSEGEAYMSLVGVESTNHAPAVRVVPGDPHVSVLYQKLEGDPATGARMPFGGEALPPAQRLLIHDWIEQGAHNN